MNQRVVAVVEPGDELVAPPVVSEPVVPDGELVLPELELLPGPPIELVLPPGDEPLLLLLLVLLSVLPLGPVLAVLGLVDGDVVLLDELLEPGVAVEPVVASRFWQAPSERAATTARVAAAH